MSVCNHSIRPLDWTTGLDSVIVKHGVPRATRNANVRPAQ